ncbi:HAD family hydrolase [Amycolatopsis benzoatilytica]|uniref:HAD family hydrolase n=1 Tax=Amycolatopsis benzoatilytica TaxID=346045 RepID=UPI00146D67A8|nr:HAD family hydrolase [Amycolatopsis benzoatilytica]
MADNLLKDVVDRSQLVLFDFDGPVCDVFAGKPASLIARQLEKHLSEPIDTDDPLAVLQESIRHSQSAVEAMEQELVAAERDAIKSASATPGGIESIESALKSGRKVGILSNNSPAAIEDYLNRFDLTTRMAIIVGRIPCRPDLMKPNPYGLLHALSTTGIASKEALLIGDSVTDIQAAKAVGAPAVGYVNKPAKKDSLEKAGASATVRSMFEMRDALH